MNIDLSALTAPWVPVNGNGDGFVTELRREVTLGHVLHDKDNIHAIARRQDCDDVLFLVDDMLAVVHLTYSGAESDPRWPDTELFATWNEFVAACANTDA